MAPIHITGKGRRTWGKKTNFERLITEVNQSITPYPEVEVNEKVVWTRTSSKGRVLNIISISLAAPLAAIALYGVLSNDREILFAVLEVLKFSLPPFLGGVAVKKLWGQSPRGKNPDEKNQGSG